MTNAESDIIRAAQAAQQPREHEMQFDCDVCLLCGRSAKEIIDRRIAFCDVPLPNDNPRKLRRW